MKNNKENNSDSNRISNFPLKILMYLSHKQGTVSFTDLTKYLNRSKSQLSVALKKMESKDLVSKSTNRPMLITITKKGISIKRSAIKSMVKYKNLEISEKKVKKQSVSPNILNKTAILNIRRDNVKENKINPESKTKKFNAFVTKTKTTIKEDLIEYFEDKVPLDLIKDITLSVSTKIHDMLFEYF